MHILILISPMCCCAYAKQIFCKAKLVRLCQRINIVGLCFLIMLKKVNCHFFFEIIIKLYLKFIAVVFGNSKFSFHESFFPVWAWEGYGVPKLPILACMYQQTSVKNFLTHNYPLFWMNILIFSKRNGNLYRQGICSYGLYAYKDWTVE